MKTAPCSEKGKQILKSVVDIPKHMNGQSPRAVNKSTDGRMIFSFFGEILAELRLNTMSIALSSYSGASLFQDSHNRWSLLATFSITFAALFRLLFLVLGLALLIVIFLNSVPFESRFKQIVGLICFSMTVIACSGVVWIFFGVPSWFEVFITLFGVALTVLVVAQPILKILPQNLKSLGRWMLAILIIVLTFAASLVFRVIGYK